MKTVLLADKNYRNHSKSYFLNRTLESLTTNQNSYYFHEDDQDLSSVFDLKVKTLREVLRKYPDDETVMLIDAFDTYSVAGDAEIEKKFLSSGADIIYSVEKNCWPERRIGDFYDSEKFLNSGGVIFKNAKFQRLLDLIVQIHDCTPNPNNQICDQYFHSVIGALAKMNLNIKFDLANDIFQSLHSEQIENFKRVDGRFVNTQTGTRPCIFHGNGDSGFHLLTNLFPEKPEPVEEEDSEWVEPTSIHALMIQVWFGKIPEYFKYHFNTTRDLPGFDFLVVTDDLDFNVDAQNYRILRMPKEEFAEKFFRKTGRFVNLENSKKVSDFKICFGDLFSDQAKGYSHIGFYDIDTLFSKMNRVKEAMQENWDLITLADVGYSDRLNGPLVIMKNRPELLRAYRIPACYADLTNPNKTDCDENSYSRHVCSNFNVKKIWNCRNSDPFNGSKNEYYAMWNDGELFSRGESIEQYHFYHKHRTKFVESKNSCILAAYDKTILSDFYWVTGFTESYSQIGEELVRSIIKYSNMKCLVYSIDFDWDMPADFLASEQITSRRFNLTKAGMDNKTHRSFMNAKPLYLIDAVEFLPHARFAYIDSDAAITANADSIQKYFQNLSNYPLINSHTHDDILVRVNGEMVNSLEILLNKMEAGRTVYPRRKCNLMIFDRRSKWFFEEQIDLYDKYAESDPNIFAVYDEDSANAILSKYSLFEGLPVVDIEETRTLDLRKYQSYSYAVTPNSESAIIPADANQIIAFHQLKSKKDFVEVEENYGQSVISQDEIVLTYDNNCVSWQKNMHTIKTAIPDKVDFILYNRDYSELFKLIGQSFKEYWTFCVWDLPIEPGLYPTKIIDSNTGRVLYSDVLEI
jgi:hypothetical protein